MPFSVREGINVFLAGFVPTENLRFREESLSFKVATGVEEIVAARPTARPTKRADSRMPWPANPK
jgi:ATP-binding cassette subfamily E protein 1